MHDLRSMLRVMSILFIGSLATVVMSAQGTKPTGPTVWDGVFTDAQADRAAGMFSQNCARCHTLTADGGRPLTGEKFWEGYTQKTVGDLLTFVKTNMPNGQGAGSLPAASYNDLVALILKSNGFPAGKSGADPRIGGRCANHPQGRSWRIAIQHARSRRRVPGTQERSRLGPHELPPRLSGLKKREPCRRTQPDRWARGRPRSSSC